jgi:hypothetical protein
MVQYSYDHEQAILGQCAVYDPARVDSLLNPLPFHGWRRGHFRRRVHPRRR